eukprot:CAMPEP_0174911702 /NCGR_PEP_ID=MMETSP0167-20121228/77829_1 /TAXON_ID=38298 /ORGANISM="Rhodella maculata, Strain CCMP736" /LENGTH=100 /DNA_ID=CAMNT_0016156263 /DNA_START=267 /DNA_END=566 /DNA_ORIENTATION=-
MTLPLARRQNWPAWSRPTGLETTRDNQKICFNCRQFRHSHSPPDRVPSFRTNPPVLSRLDLPSPVLPNKNVTPPFMYLGHKRSEKSQESSNILRAKSGSG